MKASKHGYIILTILLIVLLSLAYTYILRIWPPIIVHDAVEDTSETVRAAVEEEDISIKVYFPDQNKLAMEQRRIPRVFSQKKILKGTIEEFLKGPTGIRVPVVPQDTVLLSLYIGSDGVAYINLSEDFRRNFHGDVMDEYLLLKALYESTISNIQIDDVRILIEGKEVDSVGGHFAVERPLKQLVTQEIKFDK